MELSKPSTVDDVRNIYSYYQPLSLIDQKTAEEAAKVLERAGYARGPVAIDVAIHSEDAYPIVGTVVDHHDWPKRLIDAGAVVGPCLLNVEGDVAVDSRKFVAKGVGFWLPKTT